MALKERCISCGIVTDRWELTPVADDPDGVQPVCIPCLGGNCWSEPVGAGSVVEWQYTTGMGEYTVKVCLNSLAVAWFTSRTLTVFHLLDMGDWLCNPTGQQSPIEGEAMQWLLERWKAYKAETRWGMR